MTTTMMMMMRRRRRRRTASKGSSGDQHTPHSFREVTTLSCSLLPAADIAGSSLPTSGVSVHLPTCSCDSSSRAAATSSNDASRRGAVRLALFLTDPESPVSLSVDHVVSMSHVRPPGRDFG
eukprot:COSAG02_NODE_481_length_21461_cov_43.885597_20_plen_122_part_00